MPDGSAGISARARQPPVPSEAGGLIDGGQRLCQLVFQHPPPFPPFVSSDERLYSAGMRIALHQPEIAGNVGAVLRLAACLATPVDLIEPLGFAWDDRRVARAGMDYIDHVSVTRHSGWAAFEAQAAGRIVLLTTRGATRLHDFAFAPDDVLLFGNEGSGVPAAVHARADARVVVPMAPGLRSLNLAVSAGIVLAEALRQTGLWPESR